MTVRVEYFPLGGGLNLVTPPLSMRPGEMMGGLNYECLAEGGYGRIKGYTLFDGRVVPVDEVPGSGSVLGVHIYKGEVYAVRDDGVNGRLYKGTISGWAEVALPAAWSINGKYKFCNYNFYGQDSQEEMFIVNGIDKAVKWDGANTAVLTTGQGTDNPSDVAGHKFHLFLAVESSLVNSATGNPADFQTINGAAEIAVGDTINEIKSATSALMIGCKDSTKLLYGSDKNDWQLEHYNDSGSSAFTGAMIGGQVISMDRQGVFSLAASKAYGNFDYAAVSRKIKPLLDVVKLSHEARSVVNRDKNQYRLFFGKQGFYFTFVGQQLSGITPVNFSHSVECCTNGEDQNGDELTVFGSDNGHVYKLDDTNQFAGEPIYSYAQLAFNHSGSPTQNKRYRLADIDLRNSGDSATFYILPAADYGGGEFAADAYTSGETVPSGGALWDFALWDQFYWDAQLHNSAHIRLSAYGSNLGLIISNDGSTDSIHSIYGVTLHYSPRRLKR